MSQEQKASSLTASNIAMDQCLGGSDFNYRLEVVDGELMALAGAWLQTPHHGVFSFSDDAVAVIVNPDKLPTAAQVVVLSKLCDIRWGKRLRNH